MKLLQLVIFFSFTYLLSNLPPVFAVETHIIQPQPFEASQPVELQVTINGAQAGQNFLKAEFFKKDTTEYFGETYNGSAWYGGSDYQNYLPVEIINSRWQGNIQVKMPENYNLDREGEYFVRIRRFTQAGNYNADEARGSAVSITPQYSNVTSSISPSSIPTFTVTPSSFVPTYSLITINEVYPFPLDNEKEWVELYNFNDFSASLENWYIDDIEGGSYPRPFSIVIPAKSLGIVEIPTSVFNNSGDTVRLLDSQKNLKDSMVYDEAKTGESFGRHSFTDSSVCLQSPSKGIDNSPCISPTIKPLAIATQKPSPSPVFTFGETNNITPEPFVKTPTPFPYHIAGVTKNIEQKSISPSPLKPQVLGVSTSSQLPTYRGLQKGFLMGAISTLLINCIYICTELFKKYKQEFSLQIV